jgi:DNA-binding SARP family transcriptional activator
VQLGERSTKPQIWIEAFGGLRILREGEEIRLGPIRPVLILAELIAARGKTVSIDYLVESIWGQDAPYSAVNQIHRHVGELRRLLEPGLAFRAEGSFIQRQPNGYRLEIDASESQIEQYFSDAVAAEYLQRGDANDEALSLYAKILQTGALPAFSWLPAEYQSRENFASVEAHRLRITISAADLAISESTPEPIASLVARIAPSAPFNEVLQARAIRLLVASGRGAEAVQLFESVKKILDEELGVQPGQDLINAVREAYDPHDYATDAVQARDGASWRSSLPPDLPTFVQGTEIEEDFQDLTQALGDQPAGLIAITGMAGVGKTTLAIHWCHAVKARYPDGQFYINMRGFDLDNRHLSAKDAAEALLLHLGIDLAPVPDTESARIAVVREVLLGKKIALLLDNAGNFEQIRPLIGLGSGCLTIVTSRQRMGELALRNGARLVPLARWTVEDSLRLLTGRIGTRRVTLERDAAIRIVDSCAGLPLALSIAAARASSGAINQLRSIADKLELRETLLEELAADDQEGDVRSAFELSYQLLSPDAARLLRCISVHPAAQMTRRSIGAVAGLSSERAAAAVRELVQNSLLTETISDQFVIHDLVKVFAAGRIDGAEKREARERIVNYAALSARNVWTAGGRFAIADPPDPEVPAETIEVFATEHAAYEWVRTQSETLEALMRFAVEDSNYEAAWTIWFNTTTAWRDIFGSEISDARDRRAIAEWAELLDNQTMKAHTYRVEGVLSRSMTPLFKAVELFVVLNDAAGEANTYRALTFLTMFDSDTSAQLRYSELALAAAERSDSGEAKGYAAVTRLTALGQVLFGGVSISL